MLKFLSSPSSFLPLQNPLTSHAAKRVASSSLAAKPPMAAPPPPQTPPSSQSNWQPTLVNNLRARSSSNSCRCASCSMATRRTTTPTWRRTVRMRIIPVMLILLAIPSCINLHRSSRSRHKLMGVKCQSACRAWAAGRGWGNLLFKNTAKIPNFSILIYF